MKLPLFLLTIFFLIGCAGNKGIINSYPQEKIPFEEQYWNLIIEENNDYINETSETNTLPIKEDKIINKSVELGQEYPNPFWPTTNIYFEVFEAGNIELIIYDSEGRKVGSTNIYVEKPGKYVAKSNGVHVNSGLYFYKIVHNGTEIDIKKMIYLK